MSAGFSVGFLFGPLEGLCAAICNPIFSLLANRSEKDWIDLDEKAIEHIKGPIRKNGTEVLKAQIVYGVTFSLLGISLNQVAIHWIKQNLGTPLKILGCFFRVGVVAPLTEEIVFRGFLQEKIHDVQIIVFGKTAANSTIHRATRIVLQAILFGLCHYHVLQGAFNIYIVLATTLLGVYLGTLKEETGSIWPSISTHSLFNSSITARIWLFGA